MRISGSAYQPFTIGFDASTGTAASAHSPLINKVLKLRFMLLRLLSVVAAQFDTHRRRLQVRREGRSEEHTSELQSLMRISYAVFCLKKKHHNCVLTL